jgi:hypothetical protein
MKKRKKKIKINTGDSFLLEKPVYYFELGNVKVREIVQVKRVKGNKVTLENASGYFTIDKSVLINNDKLKIINKVKLCK